MFGDLLSPLVECASDDRQEYRRVLLSLDLCCCCRCWRCRFKRTLRFGQAQASGRQYESERDQRNATQAVSLCKSGAARASGRFHYARRFAIADWRSLAIGIACNLASLERVYSALQRQWKRRRQRALQLRFTRQLCVLAERCCSPSPAFERPQARSDSQCVRGRECGDGRVTDASRYSAIAGRAHTHSQTD